ncbi:MAG: hypothetical protein HC865_02420 [Cyanobacteria bacterium RU_5_0]|nr:hypothetical protein [Cyanobacteria bacterium RU_5_0]
MRQLLNLHSLVVLCLDRFRPYALTLLFIATLMACIGWFAPSMQTRIEQARSADSFVDSIGVNTHLRYLNTAYGRYDDIIKPRLEELGIRHIRDGGRDSEFFEKLNDLGTIGIKSTLIMSPTDGIQPLDAITIAKTVLRSIEAIEGPNETDVVRFNFSYNGEPFPEGTRNYQNALYAAIKGDTNTTSLPVLMPSMGQGRNAKKLGFLRSGDLCNMHSYPVNGAPPTDDVSHWYIPYARIVCGEDKPIVATETGYHNAIENSSSKSAISEHASNKYLPRLLLENFNLGVQRTFLYELINGSIGTNQEQNFGLLRYDGSPKPSFNTIKNLIFLLNDPGSSFPLKSLNYRLQGATHQVHHTLLQKRNGAFYLILWQAVRSWDSRQKRDITVTNQRVTVMLNTVIKKAVVYQPLHSNLPFEQYTNPQQLTLDVPDSPIAIELTPARNAEPEGEKSDTY